MLLDRISPKHLLRYKPLTSLLVDALLKLHNFSYAKAGRLSQYLEEGRVHPKHRLMKYHDWFVGQIQPDWDVLDVGCGNGVLAEALSYRCRSVTAIDLDPKKLKLTRKHRPNVTFLLGDATKYVFVRPFDAIVLSNILEHIENRIAFLTALKNVSPLFLIRVPQLERDWITLFKRERGVEWRLDNTHEIEYTLPQLEGELRECGLSVISTETRFGEFYVRAESDAT